MLYIRFPELSHLTTAHLYPLTVSPIFFSLPSLAPGDSHSVFMSLAFLNYTYKREHIVFVLIYFTSIMYSRSIHVVAKRRISFFLKAE